MLLSKKRKTISLGEITLDENMRTVTAGGNNVELTYKEYELLKLLLSHPGLVYSRQQILEKTTSMRIVTATSLAFITWTSSTIAKSLATMWSMSSKPM